MTALGIGRTTVSIGKLNLGDKIPGRRRTVLAAAGAAAGLAAALTLGPAAARSATIDQMAAQGDIARGSLACAGPFSAGAKDIVAGSGSAFETNELGVPVPVAVDWQLRRGDPSTDFFADADIVQKVHSDFFSTSVQPGSKFLPGNFWVCVSSDSQSEGNEAATVHYKMFLGNGIPA
jgi:hypothetical protein